MRHYTHKEIKKELRGCENFVVLMEREGDQLFHYRSANEFSSMPAEKEYLLVVRCDGVDEKKIRGVIGRELVDVVREAEMPRDSSNILKRISEKVLISPGNSVAIKRTDPKYKDK
jgi:hypothetical protein